MDGNKILLVYDKQCPVCDNYCRMIRIRKSVGELKLVDARVPSEIMDEITAAGLDIDQGMVLKMGDVIYYASDAIHALALIGGQSSMFNRINSLIFRSRTLSRIFYPVLRFFRNLLLKMLRKTKINNLNINGNDCF